MEKKGKLFLFCFLLSLFFISLVSSGFGYDNPNLPRIDPAINYTEIINWVNDTIYWAGHPWSDTRWLNIDGSNANQNIDIGAYDFSASGGFFDDLNVTGDWCNRTNCYTLADFLTGGGGNPFDQWVNTTSNVTFDFLNLTGRGMFMGGVDENVTYGFENVRLGVFAGTPRLMFENYNGTDWTLWEIDNGGTGLRFFKAGETTFRVNSTAVQVGESIRRRNAVVFGNIDTLTNAGGGNISVGSYFVGDGRFITNLNLGVYNSTSWNRSGVNVILSNINDFVGIGISLPSSKLDVIGNVSFDTGLYDFNVSGWENPNLLYVDGSLGTTGFGMKPSDAFARLQVANSFSVGVGRSTLIAEDTYSSNNAVYPEFAFRKSNSNTLGTKTETSNGDYLGRLSFMGVDTNTNFDYGAMIQVYQEGASGVRVPAKMEFRTFSSTGQNENQLVLEGSSGFVGINTEFPQNTLNVIGDVNFSGSAGNYAFFNSNSSLSFVGNARVKKINNFGVGQSVSGSTAPTLAIVGIFPVAQFSQNPPIESLYFSRHPNADRDVSENITVHIHWSPTDSNAGDVVWDIDFVAVTPENDEVLTAGVTSLTIIDSTQSLDKELLQTDELQVYGNAVPFNDVVAIKISRDTNNVADTYGSSASFVELHVEYISNILGQNV